jgi:hypothetical protein
VTGQANVDAGLPVHQSCRTERDAARRAQVLAGDRRRLGAMVCPTNAGFGDEVSAVVVLAFFYDLIRYMRGAFCKVRVAAIEA